MNSSHLSQAREALGAGGVPVSYLALVVPLHIEDFLFPSCCPFYIGGMLVYVRLYVCVHT